MKIDLYTALALTDTTCDNDIVYLRTSKSDIRRPETIMTLRQVKEQYDMRRTIVTKIEPYFNCGEYEGILFTVKKG